MTAPIVAYVQQHWDTLPKSTFNDEEVVIVREDHNNNEGYGHHSYAGFGIDRKGLVYFCFSSGCSCDGSCGLKHQDATKALEADEDLSNLNPAEVNFAGLQVEFSDY